MVIHRILAVSALAVGVSGCGCGRDSTTRPANPGPEERPIPTPEQIQSAAEAELKALAGKWEVASLEHPPMSGFDPEHVRQVTGVIAGDVLKLDRAIGRSRDFKIRLDPTRAPKEFDLFPLDENAQPRKVTFATGGKEQVGAAIVRGIYDLEGDRLTFALADRENVRPPAFKAGEFMPAVAQPTRRFPTAVRGTTTRVTIVELRRVK
jgi:uncharacterized protein (TIGR03067 family)